jgi:hypothetical protein
LESPIAAQCAPKVDDVDIPVTPVAQLHKLLAACMGPSFEDRRAAAFDSDDA